MIFFTADTHFGHDAILKHCRRPFATIEAMDAAIVARWNAVVGPEDTVFHLGDFCWRDRDAEPLLERLAGQKVLIVGNHDHDRVRRRHGWAGVHDYHEMAIGPTKLVLFHYPLREWNGFFRGALHFFGHVHNSTHVTPMANSWNVGVDLWDFTPRRLDEIIATPPR